MFSRVGVCSHGSNDWKNAKTAPVSRGTARYCSTYGLGTAVTGGNGSCADMDLKIAAVGSHSGLSNRYICVPKWKSNRWKFSGIWRFCGGKSTGVALSRATLNHDSTCGILKKPNDISINREQRTCMVLGSYKPVLH